MTLYQYSTFNSLKQGNYAGLFSYREILADVDLGLGTFEHLDGEMALVDGQLWRLPADGVAVPGDPASLTPFAVVTKFAPTVSFPLAAPVDFDGLVKLFSEKVPERNVPIAVRIDGVFDRIHFRSCYAQVQPYPDLAEAARTGVQFRREGLAGTVVGFRLPGYLAGLNLPGFHLHFVSQDKSTGGHVLGLNVTNATLSAQYLPKVVASLPSANDAFANATFSE
jgi:acetolactate decarboxylase